MEREKIDFTDNELKIVAEALDTYINDNDTWFGKKKVRIVNNVIKKVCNNGLKRKNKEKIIYPIFNFENKTRNIII